MRLPEISNIRRKSETVSALGGYNHNAVIGDGEFYNTENISSRGYPTLCPRKRRGILTSSKGLGAMIAKKNGSASSLIYTDGEYLRRDNGTVLLSGLSTLVSDQPKTLVAFGTKVLIFPDRKYYGYGDGSGSGDIDHTVQITSGAVYVTRCDIDGGALSSVFSGKTPPENPQNGAYWYDTSTNPASMKIYSETSGMWQAVVTSYAKISGVGLGTFEDGDTIELSGIPDNNDLRELNGKKLVAQKVVTTTEIGGNQGYIVIAYDLAKDGSVQCHDSVIVTVTRRMPRFDFAFECGNRLWICRYKDDDGKVVSEIRASKLGDYKNFDCFEGTAMDSYAVTVASDGRFTGAVSYGGYPMFFKEDTIYKIHGTQPSNFQLISTTAPGVEAGSDKSIAVVGGILMYKGTDGVYSYDGAYPTKISKALGDVAYRNAVAGGARGMYYISMRNPAGGHDLFVYDISRRMWMREDAAEVEQFCTVGDELYAKIGDKICRIFSEAGTDEGTLKWMAETGIIGCESASRKYIAMLSVRMSLAVGSSMRILVQYDSAGDWESLCYIPSSGTRTFTIPVRPKRCDHLRLRFECRGEGQIYSITKYTETGSDDR